ncbi:MAG: hypothetical protein WBG32_03305 [Nodosilinea sp.]
MLNKLGINGDGKLSGKQKQKKKIVLKQGAIIIVALLFTAISGLAIYKFDWVKIIIKHGESVLQVEGGRLD